MRTRIRGRLAAAGLLVGCLAAACGGAGREGHGRAGNPEARVRGAALRTLAAGPATIRIRVSSATVAYSVQGALDLATDRFRVRARVARAPITDYDELIRAIGYGGEAYQLGAGEPGFDNIERTACALDLHAPIGSLGGAASVQEAVALAGLAVRLLRDGASTATLIAGHAGARTYRVRVEPRSANVAPDARGSDEVGVVGPRRLARHLAPMRVTVDSEGLVTRLGLELRRFRPPAGFQLKRERRRERVSIAVSLSEFGRELEVRAPRCVAME